MPLTRHRTQQLRCSGSFGTIGTSASYINGWSIRAVDLFSQLKSCNFVIRIVYSGESQEAESSGSGSLKLSVQYAGGVLSVLILHAQSLAATPQGLPPNPYVKVRNVPYLPCSNNPTPTFSFRFTFPSLSPP